MKAATGIKRQYYTYAVFQSTPPVKAATSRCESGKPLRRVFQSTPPVKAATEGKTGSSGKPPFQSTPPVKAATGGSRHKVWDSYISIHAAREGGDKYHKMNTIRDYISIHAAREGGDLNWFFFAPQGSAFQSTPPVKAATKPPYHDDQNTKISIHAAREGGDGVIIVFRMIYVISIHAAREGGDAVSSAPINTVPHFNPRRP